MKFGLAIKTRDNRVTVSEVREPSICAAHLKVLDHLVYIDGQRVTQAEVAQQLMTKGMKEVRCITNFCQMVLARDSLFISRKDTWSV